MFGVAGPSMICFFFRAVVYELEGRTVAVQPETQIVEPMVDWVTSGQVAGLTAGVRQGEVRLAARRGVGAAGGDGEAGGGEGECGQGGDEGAGYARHRGGLPMWCPAGVPGGRGHDSTGSVYAGRPFDRTGRRLIEGLSDGRQQRMKSWPRLGCSTRYDRTAAPVSLGRRPPRRCVAAGVEVRHPADGGAMAWAVAAVGLTRSGQPASHSRRLSRHRGMNSKSGTPVSASWP